MPSVESARTQREISPPPDPGTDRPGTDRPARIERVGVRGVLWLLAYALGLAAAHRFLVAPLFGYLGFENATPQPGAVIVLILTYVLCAARLPRSWERPSAVIYWTLFLLVVAPIHVVPAFMHSRSTATWTMVFSVAAAFWLLGSVYSTRPWTIPRPALPRKIYWFCIGLLGLGLLGAVVASYGLRFNLVALADVYDVRDEFRDSFAHVPTIARYAITWLGGVIAPIIIARGLFTKRLIYVIVGVGTELLLVSITGFKSLLFSSLLVAGIATAVMRWDIRAIGAKIAPVVAGGVVGIWLFDFVTGGLQLSSLFIRRTILTAGVNTNFYFEYFKEWPKAHLAHSVLGRFFDYPYELPPAYQIGSVYYGSTETSANANLWADAFSNFGVPGVLAFTAILGALLLVIDGVSVGLPRGVPLIAFAMPAVSLSNSAMLTVFLTHGLLLALVLIALMPDEPDTESERQP